MTMRYGRLEYSPTAYSDDVWGLLRFVRNMRVHASEHGFNNFAAGFDFIDSKFNWFFPGWYMFLYRNSHPCIVDYDTPALFFKSLETRYHQLEEIQQAKYLN
ncbi:MAG: hypothetical protein ACK50N_05930 [Flavobacteriales bacterium]